ncbi:MAG: hypothetical protein M3540_10540 [Actinomycetota bacterium]|nr:hypothetical protein [Actinomycetota bacterium]
MSKRTIIVTAASLTLIALAAPFALSSSRAQEPGLDGFTARGVVVSVQGQALATLQRVEANGHVGQVLGTHELRRQPSRAFYRIETTGGAGCYGIGEAAGLQAASFAAVSCPLPDGMEKPFPSADKPVLDLSFAITPHGGTTRLASVEGFAADDVSAVQVADSAGRVLGGASVVDNTFRLSPVPDGAVVLLGLDRTGKIVYSQDHTLAR